MTRLSAERFNMQQRIKEGQRPTERIVAILRQYMSKTELREVCIQISEVIPPQANHNVHASWEQIRLANDRTSEP